MAAALWPVRALEVADLDRDRPVAIWPAQPFQLRYRHSLYGGRVWEFFAVAGTEIVLEAVEAEQEAAVEYYALPKRPARAGGRYRVSGVSHRFGELVVRATATGQRTLLVGGLELPLYAGDREGHRIRIRVVRAPAAWVGVHALWTRVREGARP